MGEKRKKERYLFRGCSSGCGTTHTAFLLGQYLRKCRDKKVCYLQFNHSKAMECLREPVDEVMEESEQDQDKDQSQQSKQTRFQYAGIQVFCPESQLQLMEDLQASFDVFLIDLGSSERIPTELQLPEREFVVCDGAEWQEGKLVQWIQRESRICENEHEINYLASYASERRVRELRRRYEREFFGIPYNHDPKHLLLPAMLAMKQIMQS